MMTSTEQGLRVCPTRVDGQPVLFAHRVDQARCQERQRQRYHKCFTCALNNSYVATHGEPDSGRKHTAAAESAVKVG